jgi:hypothetical protein
MIELIFDKEGLKEYKNDRSIIEADATILGVTGFELPVMFLVNNVNLFEFTKNQMVLINNLENQSLEPIMRNAVSSWLTLPILNFALNGLEKVRKVYKGESLDLDLPEMGAFLRLRSMDNKIEIYSTINKKTVIVDSLELLRAFENFIAEVRFALRTEVPQLLEHPYWGPWLKEG